MSRIFTILLAALTLFFGATVANSVLEELDGDAEKVSYYLKDNVNVLNYLDEEMGYAGDIETITVIRKVTVMNDQCTYDAYLSEFSNKQGFMLLADDYILLDYVRDKANPYQGIEAIEYIYNELTMAYLYKTSEGRVLSTNPNENTDIDFESGSKNFMALSDIASYLKNEYSSGYQRYIGLSMGYKPIYKPSDLVVYQKNGKDDEDNCVLTATFLALQAMKYANKLPKFPANNATTFYDVWKNESEAYQIQVDLYGKKCKYSMGYAYNFPVLYKEIRNFSSKNYWKIENLTGYQAQKLMEHMGEVYDTKINVVYSEDWQSLTVEATKSILYDGCPSLFKIYQNGKYHTMPVIGYSIYEKQTKILFFTTKKSVTFFNVFDSDFNSVYFDVTAYHGMGGMEILWL